MTDTVHRVHSEQSSAESASRRRAVLDRLGTSRQRAAEAMSEAELERGVRRILKDLPSIWARHETDSRGAREGWPDWTFLRRCDTAGAAMFWELKTEKGRATRAQQECMALMRAAGLNVGIRRPSDLLSGRIARELAALAGLGGDL